MNLKIKFSLYFFNLFLLSALILFDPRGSVISEPYLQTLSSLSIAISYVSHDFKQFVGSKEVFNILSEIPSINNYSTRYIFFLSEYLTNFNNIDHVIDYKNIITQKINEAKNLPIVNPNDIHIYFGDLGFIIFIILAFSIFGVSLNSVSFLFLSLIIISSLFIMINFAKNNILFFILQTILFSFILIIIGNYGGSTQIFSLTNYRFISIISLIPVLHLSFIFFEKEKISFNKIIFYFFQILILTFLCFVRGTSATGVIFLMIFYLVFAIFLILQKKIDKQNILRITLILLTFLSLFKTGDFLLNKNASDYYNSNVTLKKHPFWHSAFISSAFYPTIHEKFVCSDEKIKDIFEVKNTKCGSYPLLFKDKPNIIKNVIYYQPRDIFGYSAAIKYLKENGIKENLGVESKLSIELNLNWTKYEKTLKKIYFQVLNENTFDYLYIHLVIKPLKLVYEFIKFPVYFFYSFKINLIFLFFIQLLSACSLVYVFKKVNLKEDFETLKKDKKHIVFFLSLLIMFLVYCLPSLVFYASPVSALPELMVVSFSVLIMSFKFRVNKLVFWTKN